MEAPNQQYAICLSSRAPLNFSYIWPPLIRLCRHYWSKKKVTSSSQWTILALVMAARKLRQYFQACHIIVFSKQLFKDILERMSTSRRTVKWSVELNEFSIEFGPYKSINAQAMNDFIIELTFLKPVEVLIENKMPKTKSTSAHSILVQSLPYWSLYTMRQQWRTLWEKIFLLGPEDEEF